MACGAATIVADHDSVGHSITGDAYRTYETWEERGKFRGDELRSICRGRILTLMAGEEAENELLGGSDGGVDDDRYQIAVMANMRDAFSDYDEWSRYKPRMRRQARRLVRRHRDKIERVAGALLERGTLEAHEVDSLVE
jgi:hypothetical protein